MGAAINSTALKRVNILALFPVPTQYRIGAAVPTRSHDSSQSAQPVSAAAQKCDKAHACCCPCRRRVWSAEQCLPTETCCLVHVSTVFFVRPTENDCFMQFIVYTGVRFTSASAILRRRTVSPRAAPWVLQYVTCTGSTAID